MDIDAIQIVMLKGLQELADAAGVKGNYTKVLPFEQTRQGKKLLKAHL